MTVGAISITHPGASAWPALDRIPAVLGAGMTGCDGLKSVVRGSIHYDEPVSRVRRRAGNCGREGSAAFADDPMKEAFGQWRHH